MGIFNTVSAVSLYWITLRRNKSKTSLRLVITSLVGTRAIWMRLFHVRRNIKWTELVYYYQKYSIDIQLEQAALFFSLWLFCFHPTQPQYSFSLFSIGHSVLQYQPFPWQLCLDYYYHVDTIGFWRWTKSENPISLCAIIMLILTNCFFRTFGIHSMHVHWIRDLKVSMKV
jgi:hypothetical protein